MKWLLFAGLFIFLVCPFSLEAEEKHKVKVYISAQFVEILELEYNNPPKNPLELQVYYPREEKVDEWLKSITAYEFLKKCLVSVEWSEEIE